MNASEDRNVVFKRQLAEALVKAQELFQRPESDWTPIHVKHEAMSMWSLDMPNGSRMLKAQGLVDKAEPELLFREVFGQTLEAKKALGQDFLVDDRVLETIEHDEHDMVVRKQEFKLKWPLHNRQSLTARGGKLVDTEKGTWVQWETSIDHPEHPEQPSPVRTKVHLACFFFEPTEGDESQTLVTYLADVEVGGNVPQWVVNLASTKACDRILSFRRMAKEMKLSK